MLLGFVYSVHRGCATTAIPLHRGHPLPEPLKANPKHLALRTLWLTDANTYHGAAGVLLNLTDDALVAAFDSDSEGVRALKANRQAHSLQAAIVALASVPVGIPANRSRVKLYLSDLVELVEHSLRPLADFRKDPEQSIVGHVAQDLHVFTLGPCISPNESELVALPHLPK